MFNVKCAEENWHIGGRFTMKFYSNNIRITIMTTNRHYLDAQWPCLWPSKFARDASSLKMFRASIPSYIFRRRISDYEQLSIVILYHRRYRNNISIRNKIPDILTTLTAETCDCGFDVNNIH